MANLLGIKTDFKIIPFGGEYYRLPQKYNQLVAHLIYPTPEIDGSVTVGSNALLCLKRDGSATFNFILRNIKDTLLFSGFWRAVRAHFKTGLKETKNSWWRPGCLEQVRQYCPQINLRALHSHSAGISA